MAQQYEVTYKQKGGTIEKTTKITSMNEEKAKETIEKMGGGNVVLKVKSL